MRSLKLVSSAGVSPVPDDFEQLELRGFSRSLAEIDWLLLVLVLLYYVAPGSAGGYSIVVVVAMVVFALFVLGFHYVNANARQSRWKLAAESWGMILFISVVVWNTGGVGSPLTNLYLLVIISSALTLGKMACLLEILLIGSVYFYMAVNDVGDYSYGRFVQLMLYFSPFVLVAYITTLLASDIHNSKSALKTLAETDELTGLLNKRSLELMLKVSSELAVAGGYPLTVLMIDIDNLKPVNDRHGHLTGNTLLVTVARALRSGLRASDIICRYGGDEFIAILPNCPADKALEAAERLRKAVANTSFDANGHRITTTVSVGLATYPTNVDDVSTLVAKADTSLFACKRSGGNMVMHYGEEITPAVAAEAGR
ncbi:MAG TPA: GGDEF domain-containing protein [Candidatus Acidoferrum sp.]|nr:GGDEF domain-containing protein [Candidatus Acidoferrum sp.]